MKQAICEFGELNKIKRFTIKELGENIKNVPEDNPFDLKEYVGKQREGNEIDLGLFLQLAEEGEGKVVYNHAPINTLIEDMEFLRNG